MHAGIPASGIASCVEDISRDAAWHRSVEREIVRALAERERHSLPANLIGWLACVVLALAFPQPAAFALPLALRLVSIAATRVAGTKLRQCLADGRPYEGVMRTITAGVCFGGVTWGMLTWPLAGLQGLSAPAVAYAAFIMVGVSLISTLIGSFPRVMAAFLGCFTICAALGFVRAGTDVPLHLVIGLGVILCAAAAFSIGAAMHHRTVAETIVDNRRLSEELAGALAHAEFLSRRDPLTGLLNRRAFFENGNDAPPGPGHLLAIDLDHFKRINDDYGHAVGDRVLAATADVLREFIRELPGEGHRAARLGGEEFALQLAGMSHLAALATADALRLRIAAISDEFAIPGLTISASIGIAPCLSSNRLEATLQQADEALYRAKAGGRDRVVQAAA